MRLGIVAPLAESVPPALYGGTERVVHYLTEALVRLGCDVTLFASADSRTSAKLVSRTPRALRLDPEVRDQLPYHVAMLRRLTEHRDRLDLIHFHIDWLHYPLFLGQLGRTLTTLHGRLDLADLKAVYRAYPEAPLVSVSLAQRAPLAELPLFWAGTVHHCLPVDLYRASIRRGDYLLFLGRIWQRSGRTGRSGSPPLPG